MPINRIFNPRYIEQLVTGKPVRPPKINLNKYTELKRSAVTITVQVDRQPI